MNILILLTLETNKHHDSLFCFFEGKDNVYYVPRIKRFTENYCTINCGGKEAVLGVHRLIFEKNELNKYKLGFFIDRDFNKSVEKHPLPIFETPCYSIENLYVSADVFREILKNEFHLSEIHDGIFEILLELYRERQVEFHKAALLFNAWLSCLVQRRENEGINIGIKLEEKFPPDFIDINLSKVTSNYDLKKIKINFPNAIKVDENDILEKVGSFANIEQQRIFRGKYELEFLLKIIKEILNDSYNSKKIVSKKINFAFGDGSTLNQQQILNIFEAYAETPQCLLDYLEVVAN